MNPENAASSAILVIEDDAVLGAYIQQQLLHLGFSVQWCQNGVQGLELARNARFDLVLMDILLPGMNGLDILTHLREQLAVPVILMSALGAETDRITGFRNGADDYLPKPFSVAELHVRIEAVLRRVALERLRSPAAVSPVRADVRLLEFDDSLFDVRFEQRRAELTRSEYRLLETLWRNLDDVLSKAFLYQHVLQRAYAQHDRSLDMHVSQIRRKLKAIGYAEHEVRTVWGKGYVLSAMQADV